MFTVGPHDCCGLWPTKRVVVTPEFTKKKKHPYSILSKPEYSNIWATAAYGRSRLTSPNFWHLQNPTKILFPFLHFFSALLPPSVTSPSRPSLAATHNHHQFHSQIRRFVVGLGCVAAMVCWGSWGGRRCCARAGGGIFGARRWRGHVLSFTRET